MKEIAVQKRVAEVRRLTQEELLEEAKITEELNLMSLGKFLLQMDLRKQNIDQDETASSYTLMIVVFICIPILIAPKVEVISTQYQLSVHFWNVRSWAAPYIPKAIKIVPVATLLGT